MINKNEIRKILLIQTAFIGDVILITPLIKSVKNIFPGSEIDVITIPQTKSILENNPHIRNIIPFNKREGKIKSSKELLKILRRERYDIVFTPHSSLTTALIIYLAGIPIRVGFNRWAARHFLTHRVEHIKNTFKIKKNLNLLSPFHLGALDIQTELFPTNKMTDKAKTLIKNIRNSSKRIVAIAPGSNWFTKRWPIEHYEILSKKLSELNIGIVFIGSKEEREICNDILPVNGAINLAGELSLLESAAVIEQCDLMICNDSGAMHLANAMQTDVIVFFGPTVEKIGYFPFRKNDIVFQLDLECRPCSSHGTNECPLKHFDCMKKITPEMVAEKIKTKLAI